MAYFLIGLLHDESKGCLDVVQNAEEEGTTNGPACKNHRFRLRHTKTYTHIWWMITTIYQIMV